MLGYTQNSLGAFLLVRKTGRNHTRNNFLEENQNDENNFFSFIGKKFVEEFVKYLNTEEVYPLFDIKK